MPPDFPAYPVRVAAGVGPGAARALAWTALLLSTGVAAAPAVAPSVAAPPAAAAPVASFETMLAGFAQCRYEGLYVSDVAGQAEAAPDTPWFRAHPGIACGQDENFHYLCLNERYHGLEILRMAVPGAGGIASVMLYARQDLASARAILKATLGSEFRASRAADRGDAPLLLADPGNPRASVLVCTPGQ